MTDESRKLQDILVVCVLRYGQTQDSRFALAALVAYQAFRASLRSEAMGYLEDKLGEIEDRVVTTIPQQTKADVSHAALAAFVRSTGLVEALKGGRAATFDSERAKLGLRRIAPELATAIEVADLRAVYSFLKPDYAFQAVA